MAVTKIKKCKNCGKEYEPTSNAQKNCTDCGKKLNLEKTKIRKRNKTHGTVPNLRPSARNSGTVPSLTKGEFKVSRKGKLYIAPSSVIASPSLPVILRERGDRRISLRAGSEKQSQFIDVIKDILRNEVDPVIENIKIELKKLEGMIA